MKLLLSALILLCAPAIAGQKTVTGQFVATTQRAIRDVDGTQHYPSWELRIPRWDAVGCYRADGSPASIADLERVDVFFTENIHTWTWVENQSSQARGWWMLSGGTRTFLSRVSMEGVADPAATGFACWDGATIGYMAGDSSLAPNETASGYYWGPVPPGVSVWIGPGDRAAINMWARPTPGLGNDLRRFISLRAEQEWLADWAGHASWSTRIEAGFAPTVTVVYRYRDVPDPRHLRAVASPWMRSVIEPGGPFVEEQFPGLPAPYLASDVRRAIVQHKYDVALQYGVENEGTIPANCGGTIYMSTDVEINGGRAYGLGTAFNMGAAGPSNLLTAWDGTTDWGGGSGLYVASNRWGSVGGDDAANIDSDAVWPSPHAFPWGMTLAALSQDTLRVRHSLIPASGFYPASATSGVPDTSFAWGGALHVAPQTRVIWFVEP